MQKDLIAMLAGKFLIHRMQSGANVAPGSPMICESIALATSVIEGVDEYEDVLAAEKKAKDDAEAARIKELAAKT